MKVQKRTKTWYTTDEGFEFVFEPIEDSVTVKETKDGYEVRYLTQDDNYDSPDDWGDNSLFLTGYHRDFSVESKIVSKRDCQILVEDDLDEDEQARKEELQKEYWTFGLEAYIHSGVRLAFRNMGNFPDRLWDVSFVGLIFADKKEFKTEKDAENCAKGLIDTWNMYLSGEVYGCIKEIYDKDKQQIDHDICWGYYGYKHAIEELEHF